MNKFKVVSKYSPAGDQGKAIEELSDSLNKGTKLQTLKGATGTGKTYVISKIVEKHQKPTLVLTHNKTLAAQLYRELKELFPNNKVEYFVSYYDYYQPESYVPQRDLYIEKNTKINEKIEELRLSATASIASREDTIVVVSVSCIYSLGNPEKFKEMGFEINLGQNISRLEILEKLVNIQYERNDMELSQGRFRVKGDVIDLILGYSQNIIRIELFGKTIDRITEIDKITGEVISKMNNLYVFPAKHFVIDEPSKIKALESIEKELNDVLPSMGSLEAQRLKQRTMYDLEMIREAGYCSGIENYSRHFDGRKPGERAYTLIDYFPKDFLLVIDESHQTLPQLRAMYAGDFSRKKNLIDYGFRLPSAYDNRPLKFPEFEKNFMNKVIFVSATPGDYELSKSKKISELIIRPTGLVDPPIEIVKSEGQIKHLINNINETIKKGFRVLVTTLTKKLAEEISEYLAEQNIKTRYLHSEINTLERSEIIRELRLGKFDCLVGINLLREGLDIPEVGLIGILDADKEGFLRDQRSLIQIIGRAARNKASKVILYADKITDSIKKAVEETDRRRNIQLAYNKKNNITPKTIIKPIEEKHTEIKDVKSIPKKDVSRMIIELEKEMRKASDNLDFEAAITLRDKINILKTRK